MKGGGFTGSGGTADKNDAVRLLDDVQEVYSNLKITDEALAGLA